MVKLVEMKRTVMPSDIIVKLLCVGTADDKDIRVVSFHRREEGKNSGACCRQIQ